MAKNKLRKFRVSLACLVPLNYEMEVEADNEQEALDLALMEFPSEDKAMFEEPLYDDVALNLGEEELTPASDGVFIEERKEEDK